LVYRPAIRVKTVQRILDPTEKTRELVLEPGTHVVGLRVIARGKNIRDIDRLVHQYKLPNGALTRANDWTKMAGFAVLRDGEDLIYGEIHWYQGKHIGRVEFKLKRELPGDGEVVR